MDKIYGGSKRIRGINVLLLHQKDLKKFVWLITKEINLQTIQKLHFF